MNTISQEKLQAYRQETFRLTPQRKLCNIQDAADFVKARGFVYLWPIKGITLPSLWAAVAGDRQVANEHDDPGHITWGWKDDALGKRIWYYGKILRKKATLIDLEVAPYFYALSENYGDPEEDVRIAYQDGRLPLEAKTVFETIVDHGPLDTIAIRRATHMTNKESNSRFDRALSALQADFKILPVGISDAGAWRYAFIYDLTHRHHPELLEKARYIKQNEAHQKLLELYLLSVGAAQIRDIKLLFRWSQKDIGKAINLLQEKRVLSSNITLNGAEGKWIAIKKLLT
jgi:hypothetical protein